MFHDNKLRDTLFYKKDWRLCHYRFTNVKVKNFCISLGYLFSSIAITCRNKDILNSILHGCNIKVNYLLIN